MEFLKTELEIKIQAHLQKYYSEYGIIETDIEIKEGEDYSFAVSHTKIKTSTGMHVYGMYAFYGWELIYKTNNVIDLNKRQTLEGAQFAATNYFEGHSKKLNKLWMAI